MTLPWTSSELSRLLRCKPIVKSATPVHSVVTWLLLMIKETTYLHTPNRYVEYHVSRSSAVN